MRAERPSAPGLELVVEKMRSLSRWVLVSSLVRAAALLQAGLTPRSLLGSPPDPCLTPVQSWRWSRLGCVLPQPCLRPSACAVCWGK